MSNSRWLDWVEEEAREIPEHRPLNKLPPPQPSPAPSTYPATTTPSSSIHTRYIAPTKEQLDAILPNPVECFCQKPAHRTYTSEYGPILVCSNFELDPTTTLHKTQSKYVCGFHVHEISWTKFCDTLKTTNRVNVDHSELRSCPLYNFTFCALFRTSNKYDMNPPIILPNCFCHNPVVMRINKTNNSISFACKNGDIDGAKKCSWILGAHQVAFPRPKFHIHKSISHDEYMAKKHETLEKITSPVATPPAEGHKADLLAALSRPSNNVNAVPLSKLSLQQPKPTTVTTAAAATPATKPLIIPTCVMGKRPTTKPVLSRSSSSSTTSSLITSPVVNSDTDKNEEQQAKMMTLKPEFNKLKVENTMLKSAIDTLTTENENMASKVDRLKDKISDLQTELHRSKNENYEENILRLNCQERLSKIELDVVHLMNDNEKLKEEVNVMLEEKAKSGKDEELNKCRLCFTRNIEYCLLPCYHYAYCQLCAQKLTECAICRTEIYSIQKIYGC